MTYLCRMISPLGPFIMEETDGAITRISLDDASCPHGSDTIPELPSTPLLKRAYLQMSAYFAGTLRSFDLPLNPQGTEFQRKVWRALTSVPYGETVSYGEIARRIDSPNASRAVGGALNRNPIWIVLPCHRVIGANGSLTGYEGGLSVKQFLLDLEKKSNSVPSRLKRT